CYMSDREVSIRVGKGFWSRGPGPSTIPRSADFPSLRVQQAGPDNLGQLFQAQLELIQLFSNAHDILYSSAGHRAQLYLGGEYDDSFAVLRKWKLVWGSLSFTPLIKAALNLSYEFLRLYINAFAFQATINRAITRARQQQQQLQQQSQTATATASSSQPQQQQPPQQQPPQPQPTSATTARTTTAINTPLFGDLASTPDARFIYESMDAANSLLNILNTSVDPVTGLRYMPLKYYLYVIYAAVFLFKARLAGALGAEASDSVRRSISTELLCRGFSWRDLDDLGQFIGPPADMAFADPTGLHVVGNISLDEGAAYDVLWPGNDVVF
ncbi:3-oxoacyl-[acyl-carrier-protein] reductase, partial [Colletotrichum sp. SAR 10_65]